jgi:transcriptional regulator with XRE-family HTH domain
MSDAAADALPPEPSSSPLGERLRHARTVRGLSLRELARRLEISPSLVSQIETGKIQPSVRTLYAIVTELDVSMDDMFAAAETQSTPSARPASNNETVVAQLPVAELSGGVRIQRAPDAKAIDLESGVRWERLSAGDQELLEFLHTTYQPGGSSSRAGELVRHNGREFGFILSGRLNVTVGFNDYVVGPGDSITFESTTPHRLHNDGDEAVHAIWVVLGRYAGVQ